MPRLSQPLRKKRDEIILQNIEKPYAEISEILKTTIGVTSSFQTIEKFKSKIVNEEKEKVDTSDLLINSEPHSIMQRKNEHIKWALDPRSQTRQTNWLEFVKPIHISLPNLNFEDIDIGTTFLRRKVDAPLLLNALTGGTNLAKKVNKNLAIVANTFNIPLMVGSQRIAIDPKKKATQLKIIKESFSIVRQFNPEGIIIGNIGVPQLIDENYYHKIPELIDDINANALAIHLNPLQESIQPKGELKFKNALKFMKKLKSEIRIPVIVKETGSGISKEIAKVLIQNGINYIDVSGIGGTSFSAIEGLRTASNNYTNQHEENNDPPMKKHFWDWGIPTAAAIMETKSVSHQGTHIIASGGIRNGVDCIKSLMLGAEISAIAQPLLKPALKSEEQLNKYIKNFIIDIKNATLLTGCRNLKELRHIKPVIMGDLKEWIIQRL